jgi:hypothetical protein
LFFDLPLQYTAQISVTVGFNSLPFATRCIFWLRFQEQNYINRKQIRILHIFSRYRFSLPSLAKFFSLIEVTLHFFILYPRDRGINTISSYLPSALYSFSWATAPATARDRLSLQGSVGVGGRMTAHGSGVKFVRSGIKQRSN